MGAIVNMEPKLYKGIISNVPFVDVITTMSDPSIPLTTGEYDEWGNPENKKEFEYMMKYSLTTILKKMNIQASWSQLASGIHKSNIMNPLSMFQNCVISI